MHDKIDGQHQPEPHRFGRERVLALERTLVAGDMIRRNGIRILDRELDMIKSSLPQVAHRSSGDADTRCDEVGIETGPARRSSDLDQIAPRARLAAG